MSGETLLALAERCEKAERGSRDLDADIYEALGFEVKRTPRLSENRWGGKRYGRSWAFLRGSRWEAMRSYSTSLDAALALTGKDTFWRLGNDGEGPDVAAFKATITSGDGPTLAFHDAVAATPALALCAAALRARGARHD